MRKLFYILVAMFLITSCESKQDIKEDIDELERQRNYLVQESAHYRSEKIQYYNEVERLKSEVSDLEKEMSILKSGESPKYILKLRLKQSRVSLDLFEHAKDAMNAIEFEIPVDKEFYNQVSVGDEIVDNFRAGSFIINGSFGSWNMKIKGKEIR